jgi:hypothetical protein
MFTLIIDELYRARFLFTCSKKENEFFLLRDTVSFQIQLIIHSVI